MSECLVAEMALLPALLGQSMKLRWKLSLQVRGDGPARLIATDYYAPVGDDQPARIRAYASYDADRLDETANPFSQIGKGYFAILIDQGEDMTPYQGITPIAGGSLAACAQTYFSQSEQLPTRFELSFGRSQLAGEGEHWRAGGMMLQHMPKASPHVSGEGGSGHEGLLEAEDILTDNEAENWTRANTLPHTVSELYLSISSVTPSTLFIALFHHPDTLFFHPTSVIFVGPVTLDHVRLSLCIHLCHSPTP